MSDRAPATNPNPPVTVVIAGEPVAKARPRLTRRGIAYTPAHTRKYEAHVRLAAQLAGARLTVREGPDGKPRFATYRPAPDGRQSCGGQPPMRSNAGEAPAHEGVEEATS